MIKHQAYWIGFFSAALVSLPIAIGLWGATEDFVLNLAHIFFGAAATLLILLMIVLMFRSHILRWLFGRTEATATEVASGISGVALAVSSGNSSAAIEEVGKLGKTVTAWYAWQSFYKWVIGTAFALIVGVAGLTGTVLLFQQNEKIDEQTTRIDIQNAVMTLSLTDDFRRRLLRDKNNFFGAESEAEVLEHSDSLPCSLQYSMGFNSGKIANRSTMISIVNLARRNVIDEQISTAIEPLLHDDDQFVALSALKILDELDSIPEDTSISLNQAYVNGLSINSKIRVNIQDSLVNYFFCPNCDVYISNSFVENSTFAFLDGMNGSFFINDHFGPIRHVWVGPVPVPTGDNWLAWSENYGVNRADINRLRNSFYYGSPIPIEGSPDLPGQLILDQEGRGFVWAEGSFSDPDKSELFCPILEGIVEGYRNTIFSVSDASPPPRPVSP